MFILFTFILFDFSLIQYYWYNLVSDLKQEHIPIMKALMNVWKVMLSYNIL